MQGQEGSAWLGKARASARAVHVDAVVIIWTSKTKHGHTRLDAVVVDASSDTASGAVRVLHATDAKRLANAVRDEVLRVLPAPAPAPAAAVAATATAPARTLAAPPPAGATNAAGDSRATPVVSSVGRGGDDESHGDDGGGVPATLAGRRWGSVGRPTHAVGREFFEVSAGAGGGTRTFGYTDGLSKNLRDYRLGAAPVLGLAAAVYPFANLPIAVLSDLGVLLGYSQAFAVQSESADQSDLGTRWTSSYAGGRLRIRTGGDRAPLLGVTGAYSNESFAFTSASAPPASSVTSGPQVLAGLPSVAYTSLKTGVDVRIPIGSFAIVANGDYLAVVSAGGVAANFPHAHVKGIDAGLGGAFTITPGLEARLFATYRRYFYSLDPVPGDAYVAGGALDEFWDLQGRIAYVY